MFVIPESTFTYDSVIDHRYDLISSVYRGIERGAQFRSANDPLSRIHYLINEDRGSMKETDPFKFCQAYLAQYVAIPVPKGIYVWFADVSDRHICFNMDTQYDSIIRLHPEYVPRLQAMISGVVAGVRTIAPLMKPVVSEVPVEIDTLEKYIVDLSHGKVSYMMGEIYDTPESHYKAYNSRIGEIISIIAIIPEDVVVHAPGDGIGVVAIAGRLLGRTVISSEPSGIGKRAVDLGLMQGQWSFDEHVKRYPKGFYLLSHLARFVDPKKFESLEAVVYDQVKLSLAGFRSLHWSGVLTTNSKLIQEETVVVHMSRVPDVSHTGVRLSTADPYIQSELEMQGVYDPTSRVRAVYDKTQVLTGEEYVLMERRVASAITNRPGATITSQGVTTYVSGGDNRVYTPDMMKCLRPQTSTTTLDQSFDLCGLQYARVIVGFNPSRLQFAHSNGVLIRVEVMSVDDVTVAGGKPLYDVMLRADYYWLRRNLTCDYSFSHAMHAQYLANMNAVNYRHASPGGQGRKWRPKKKKKKVKVGVKLPVD